MNYLKILTLSAVTHLVAYEYSRAQQTFVEGELKYRINIKQNNPEASKQELNGTLLIKLKSGAVLKELTLDNNTKTTQLILSAGRKKQSYSFVQVGDKNFAVQQDFKQLEQKIGRCKSFNLQELPIEAQSYGGFKTQRATISCNDQRPFTISYTKEWSINNPYIFEEFSSFTHLPLAYQINLDNGSQINCSFISIKSSPMNNSEFEVPKNYTIISQEELRSWQH